MTTLADFVGKPFADHGREGGFDCWGLVRAVLKSLAGIRLPDYGDGYADVGDFAGVESAIRSGLADGWERVADPRLYDLVIFNIHGQPRHVGMMIGPSKFLHCPEWMTMASGQRVAGTSRIERVTDRMWCNRIEGFYRYVG